jgi:hypothetical protein
VGQFLGGGHALAYFPRFLHVHDDIRTCGYLEDGHRLRQPVSLFL